MKLRTKKLIAREFLIFLGCIIISFLTYIGILLSNFYHQSRANKLLHLINKERIVRDSLAQPFIHKNSAYQNNYVPHSNREAYLQANQQSPDKVSKFYRNLLSDGYTEKNLGSEDDFRNALSDPAKSAKIYNNLLADGYTVKNLGGMDKFLKTFNAVQVNSFKVGKDTFDIPVAQTQDFLKDYPQAQSLSKNQPSNEVSRRPASYPLPQDIITSQDSFNYRKAEELEVRIYELSDQQEDHSERIISYETQKQIVIYVFFGLITLAFFGRYLFLAVKYSIQILREK